jgi:sRNA-binding regulator protein Hfq
MDFTRRHFKRRPGQGDYSGRPSGDHHYQHQQHQQQQQQHHPMHPETTGAESEYFRSLIDSHAEVTVVLTNGERMQGHIRYYDRDCFSLGISAEGPRFLIRKDSVAYIAEE